MLEFEGIANACPCSICRDWRERNGMGEFAKVTEPTDDLVWGNGDWDVNPVSSALQDLVREHGAVKVQNALDETTAGAFLEYVGTDAQKWAQEYCGYFGGDEGLLIGWFANAIEAGKAARNEG